MGPRPFKMALFIFVCLLLFVASSRAQFMQDERHVEVALRMIGHQVLLSSGDSLSRVLPIRTEEDGRYRIQFESEFAFSPEELATTINDVVRETGMATHFIVEVAQCGTEAVVYSYEMQLLEHKDLIPCKSRGQPKACYQLFFTLLDRGEPLAAAQEVVQGPSNGWLSKLGLVTYSLLSILFLVLLGALIYLWRRRKNSKVDPNMISLGEYRFDKRNTELVLGNQRTELTGKEADLLLLLYKAANTSVAREVILNKVWGDQGDYVGRTLDVFISKLRKKFEADPKVKIVNIRGVGYKLVIGV
ncbi:winged helix-turn-helix domain-containing protein [Ulvibacterium sp.]|uniref:winged helix-turn-helix domain-containing protein n=1 Tax=Ulvibacterium sp. TaxID=2665914 RepID=UPI00261DC5AB|nr:winged helix-turn-helix domain-containing protein [Ulvibacterium sp.]